MTTGTSPLSQAFVASGTFVVPAGVSLVFVSLMGGGAGGMGGHAGSLYGACGGGAGQWVNRLPVKVTPGASIAVIIGIGGTAGAGVGNIPVPPAGNGGNTYFGTYFAEGGKTGTGGSSVSDPFIGGLGGGANPATVGTGLAGTLGKFSASQYYFSGSSGGGGSAASATGATGGGAPGMRGGAGNGASLVFGGRGGGGAGGGSTVYGLGGTGGHGGETDDPDWPHGSTGAAGGGFGAGGGGGGSVTGAPVASPNGGTGASGYCLVQWVKR